MSKNTSNRNWLQRIAVSFLILPILASANMLESIKEGQISSDGSQTVVFGFTEPLEKYDTFETKNPDRVAIDFKDTQSGIKQRLTLLSNQGPAKSVEIAESGQRTRAVINLSNQTHHTIKKSGNYLSVTFDGNARSTLPPASIVLNSVDYSKLPSGTSRLTLRFSDPSAFINMTNNKGQIAIDMAFATLGPDFLASMSGVPAALSFAQGKNHAGQTRLTAVVPPESSVLAYQSGNEYVLEIAPPKAQVAQPAKAPPVSKNNKTAKNNAKPETKKQSTAAAPPAAVSAQPQPVASQPQAGYKGKKVSFNFQDVPVRTVLQLLADESGLNVVASDTVNGNITLRLVSVPWDQALDIVLRSRGLDKRMDGDVIWIGPQKEIADYEQAKEDARIATEVREETITEHVQINYGSAEDIAKLLTENSKNSTSAAAPGGAAGASGSGSSSPKGFLSSRGSVSFDARTNTLLVIDIPEKIIEIKDLVAKLDRPVDQVLIEARIVIATSDFAREIGSKFGISSRDGIDETNPGTTRNLGFASLLPATAATSALNFSILSSSVKVDVELSAMEERGEGEVISNPRVITSNQKEAVIKQGEEVGYITVQAQNADIIPQATVQFKEVLLELKVTPTITQDNRVFLNLYVKKDEIKAFVKTPSGDIPQIAKREMTTSVMVENGQTLVVGGVYEVRNRQDISKVPFLGDIPFLGNLFKKTGKSAEKAELLIFITPKVMRPVNRTLAEVSGIIGNQ